MNTFVFKEPFIEEDKINEWKRPILNNHTRIHSALKLPPNVFVRQYVLAT